MSKGADSSVLVNTGFLTFTQDLEGLDGPGPSML